LLQAEFESGLAKLGIDASPEQVERLAVYMKQLRKWNDAYNLVSRGDIDHLFHRHLLDSLAINPFVTPGELLDAGTGAGFPGLALAIVRPDVHVTLLDSAGKKFRFLRHVIRTLGLENAKAVHNRIEAFSPGAEFSTITSRAFGSLREFAECVRHLAGPETRLLAMKGKSPLKEMEDLPGWIATEPLQSLEVPGLDAERHLVIMTLAA